MWNQLRKLLRTLPVRIHRTGPEHACMIAAPTESEAAIPAWPPSAPPASARPELARKIFVWALSGLLLAFFVLESSAGTGLESWSGIPPFSRIQVWLPSARVSDPFRPQTTSVPPAQDVMVLLHGTQSPTTSDPTWLAWLRARRPFDQKILVVPAIADARQWNTPTSIQGIRGLLDHLAADRTVDPKHTYIMGFSAGASRGFQAVAALSDRIGGFAALAGYPPTDLSAATMEKLKNVPILLACMEYDSAVPCSGQADAAARLRKAGVKTVETATIRGLGHECNLDYVAPLLAGWLERIAGR